MSDAPPPLPLPPPDGRSFRWRLGALLAGCLFGGAAYGLFVKPELLAYAVAAGFALVALLCVAGAFLAKGR